MTSREKDIRNALSHLLPTTSSLPSILVSTSSSIFDKSRSKVPLRPDEEPARVWLASYLAAERLGTVLGLPAPKLHKHSPVPIPEKVFKRILGTFKNSVPLELPRRVETTVDVKLEDVKKEVSQLCTKLGTVVSEGYILKTLDPILQAHPRRDSLHVIIAGTFLIISSHKDEQTRKLLVSEKKKVLDAFDGRFTNKDLTEWMKIIESELEESKWFEQFPVTNVELSRKRKIEGDTRKVKLAKNISGIGIMMQPEISFGQDKQLTYEAWRDEIVEQVKKIEESQTHLKALKT